MSMNIRDMDGFSAGVGDLEYLTEQIEPCIWSER